MPTEAECPEVVVPLSKISPKDTIIPVTPGAADGSSPAAAELPQSGRDSRRIGLKRLLRGVPAGFWQP
ncbi:hypothetical protein GCM10009753_62330 [Streptantibioticus ferralitis]